MEMRLFVAIDTDHAAKRAIGKLIERIRRLPGRISWNRPHQFHVTLVFLGAAPGEVVPQIAAAMQRAVQGIVPFEFDIKGLGAFPDLERPRVLWVGVEDSTGSMAKLQQRLNDELAALGFPPEDRKFHPHITLGRVKQPDRRVNYTDELFNHLDFAAPAQEAGELVLFSSDLGDDGATYTPVARISLK